MSRFIFNIIIIIIIGFSLTIIPMNENLVSFSELFNFSSDEEEPTPEEEAIVYNYKKTIYDEDNPEKIKFTLTSSSPSLDFEDRIIVDVYEGDNLITSFTENELVLNRDLVEEEAGTSIQYTIATTAEALGLQGGNYTLTIYAYDAKFDNLASLTYDIRISNDINYVADQVTIPEGQVPVTLFFPEETINYLIPVTRFIPQADDINDAISDELAAGPVDTTTLQPAAAPISSNLVMAGSTLYVRYSKEEVAPYNQGSTAAIFAIDTYTETYTWREDITGVQFLVNNNYPRGDFHGMYLDEPQRANHVRVPYLGYQGTDRVYLFPMYWSYDPSITLEGLFMTLTNEDTDTLIYPFPAQTTLKSLAVIDGIVHLDVSAEVLSLYQGKPNRVQFMMDSLAYTYGMLPDIEGVSITFDGVEIDNLAGQDLRGIFSPTKMINPE